MAAPSQSQPTMKLHLLRYFVVLAEELHFGRAAQRLSITQPPLSSAIKALEDELGVRLLERNSKQVALTPAGAAYLAHARLVLERYREAIDGDIRMNCDVCVHRVALPGFEEKVGAPATPHYHPDENGHGHSHDHDHAHVH